MPQQKTLDVHITEYHGRYSILMTEGGIVRDVATAPLEEEFQSLCYYLRSQQTEYPGYELNLKLNISRVDDFKKAYKIPSKD